MKFFLIYFLITIFKQRILEIEYKNYDQLNTVLETFGHSNQGSN
jgi:hypothetical protein